MDYTQLIDDYLAGPQKLRAAVAGMTAEQLDARPIPGKWSSKQVICHIADFEPVYLWMIGLAVEEAAGTIFPVSNHDPPGTGQIGHTLWFKEARDRMQVLALLDIEHFQRVVSQSGHEQSMSLDVGCHVVDPSFDAGHRDRPHQFQRHLLSGSGLGGNQDHGDDPGSQ